MRFGNPAPTATEVAAGDLAGSGEDNDPKAPSAKRKRRPTPWAAGVAAARGHDMAVRMDSLATGATTSRCARGWSFHRPRQARLFAWPAIGAAQSECRTACLRHVETQADVMPLAGWSGATNFPVRAVPWPSAAIRCPADGQFFWFPAHCR